MSDCLVVYVDVPHPTAIPALEEPRVPAFVDDDAHALTPTRGHLRKGCWRYYSPGERTFPLRLIAGEDDMSTEAEKYHDYLFLWVCTLVCHREGITKKSAKVRAVPGGGGML